MTEIFMYADEAGDLDMSGSPGSSTYFGFGTAVFSRDHGAELWEGLKLRCHLEERGIRLPKGLHAVNDSHETRNDVFSLIKRQAPRIDTTFLLKKNAYDSIKEAGQTRLYKMAWFLHFKEIAKWVTEPGDTLYVIIGSLQTNNKRGAIRHALEDVCTQAAGERTIVPCIWDAHTSWGIQVADYALWAVQRVLEGRTCSWYEPCVEPSLRTRFLPWGAGMNEGRKEAGYPDLSGSGPLDLLSPACPLTLLRRPEPAKRRIRVSGGDTTPSNLVTMQHRRATISDCWGSP